MNNLKTIIANNLKHFRKLRDLSQEELSKKINVRRTTYLTWEKTGNIPIDKIENICTSLDISIAILFNSNLDLEHEIVKIKIQTTELILNKLREYIEDFSNNSNKFLMESLIYLKN